MLTVEGRRGGFVKVTHREARCCSGSWACSPKSERLFSTDPYQRASGPSNERGKKSVTDDWMTQIWCSSSLSVGYTGYNVCM